MLSLFVAERAEKLGNEQSTKAHKTKGRSTQLVKSHHKLIVEREAVKRHASSHASSESASKGKTKRTEDQLQKYVLSVNYT